MTGFFVTGTDTGVGKTFVSCMLARRATSTGQKVFAFKPIETGCTHSLGDDQKALCEAAGDWQTGDLQGLYRLRRPVAPLVAARAEDIEISIERILETTNRGSIQADLTIVEGAGGWRVPITETVDMAWLARRLRLPIIIVARATLGTINHSLLTIEAVERAGCQVDRVILSAHPHDDLELAQSNQVELQRRWSGRIELLRST